jgi:hypothetical protein
MVADALRAQEAGQVSAQRGQRVIMKTGGRARHRRPQQIDFWSDLQVPHAVSVSVDHGFLHEAPGKPPRQTDQQVLRALTDEVPSPMGKKAIRQGLGDSKSNRARTGPGPSSTLGMQAPG